MIISERIFMLMEEKKISQLELSAGTGIAQSTISDWKRKRTNPAADKIMVICRVLDVTPYELLQGSEPKTGQLDYLVCTEGTDNYDFLVEYESLNTKQKERMKGYLNAIKEL